MTYRKTTVNKFGGLNSNVSPELIQDGEARDICNFRMEKIGKLVSRDGYIYSAFEESLGTVTHPTGIYSDYLECEGILGIGELILESKWDDIDTDRLMVYIIRGVEVDGRDPNHGNKNYAHYQYYMFSPMSGAYKNKLVTDEDCIPTRRRKKYPQGDRYKLTEEEFLFAPNRFIPQSDENATAIDANTFQTVDWEEIFGYDRRVGFPPGYGTSDLTEEDASHVSGYSGFSGYSGIIKHKTFDPQYMVGQYNLDEWHKQYVDVSQYRHKLIISDPINGDMVLEDEYSVQRNCEEGCHKLILRPNCLESFDIDNVEIDLRFNDNQENSLVNGVESAMALYKWKLPKKVQIPTNDHFTPVLSDEAAYSNLRDLTQGNTARDFIVNRLTNQEKLSFYSNAIWLSDPVRYAKIYHDGTSVTNDWSSDTYVNTEKNYTFTNADQPPSEFDDIFGKLELEKDDIINEDGTQRVEYASDVYLWNDYKLKYYPSYGKDIASPHWDGNYLYLLSEHDRTFTKLLSKIPRIIKLETKKNAGKYAPLGVWKYRFVWDFGDGVYSAPSTDLVVPDIMWSAVRNFNDDNEYNLDYNDTTRDTRPRYYKDDKDVLVNNDWLKSENSCSGYSGFSGYPGYAATDYIGYNMGADATQQYRYLNDNPRFFNEPLDNVNGLYTPTLGNTYNLDIDLTNPFTEVGNLFYELKKEIYGEEHLYGCGYEDITDFADGGIFDITDMEDRLKLVNIPVCITAFFSESDLPLNGFIGEYSVVAHDDWKFADDPFNYYVVEGGGNPRLEGTLSRDTSVNIKYSSIKLNVPVFKREESEKTYNSVFDDDGRCRLAYLYENDAMRRRIVFSELNGTITHGLLDVNSSRINTAFEYMNKTDDVWFNIMGLPIDYNNVSVDLQLADQRHKYLLDRVNTIFRGISTDKDSLLLTKPSVPNEVIDRILVSGLAEIKLCDFGNDVGFDSEHRSNNTDGDWIYALRNISHETGYNRQAKITSVVSAGSGGYGQAVDGLESVDNLRIIIYGDATRFLGMEQLTAYFPSSILFGAPRLGIKIPSYKIPVRAKKLLIFRTKSTHSNDYQPTEYGLVKELDIRKLAESAVADYNTEDGKKITDIFGDNIDVAAVQKTTTCCEEFQGEPLGDYNDNESFRGIYFFDDVKDDALDFGTIPSAFEGIRFPLKSRYNIPLNEKVYYFNFDETYQPDKMRKSEIGAFDAVEWKDELLETTTLRVTDSTVTDEGYDSTWHCSYKFIYEDVGSIVSQENDFYTTYNGSANYGNWEVEVAGTVNQRKVVTITFLPSKYDGYIKSIKVYRAKALDTNKLSTADYYYIGEVKDGDEGIFVDTDIPDGEILPCTDPIETHYESGLRPSEPFNPSWMKAENFYEYRSGDGMQGTGVESQYGNLVLFKETSMHRVAVQGKGATISRTDEITPEIGCIAPNSLINVNNVLYFLSWKGFISYDNNQLKKIDGAFDNELQYILQNTSPDLVRDASCGYNPAHNEIYLNIPKMSSNTNTGLEYEYSENEYYNYTKKVLGHMFVINLDKGYTTKFSYLGTRQNEWKGYLYRDMRDGRQFVRKYYTNSYGELRSGDILPSRYYATANKGDNLMWWYGGDPLPDGYLWAGIYCETPYDDTNGSTRYYRYIIDRDNNSVVKEVYSTLPQPINPSPHELFHDKDACLNPSLTGTGQLTYFPGLNRYLRTDQTLLIRYFPVPYYVPIQSKFRSKLFTGDDETLIKRVRKAIINIFSKGVIDVQTNVIPTQTIQDGITDKEWLNWDADVNKFTFNPTDYIFNESIAQTDTDPNAIIPGTMQNIISVIPETQDVFDELGNQLDVYEDHTGKPIKFAIEIDTENRTEINQVGFYWRAIHTYLA